MQRIKTNLFILILCSVVHPSHECSKGPLSKRQNKLLEIHFSFSTYKASKVFRKIFTYSILESVKTLHRKENIAN